ncbi:hypothetical protein FPV67DRAFT_1451646, partial [Lyophyllum atratum]
GADDALIRGSSNLVLTKSNFTQERSFHLLNANHQVDRKPRLADRQGLPLLEVPIADRLTAGTPVRIRVGSRVRYGVFIRYEWRKASAVGEYRRRLQAKGFTKMPKTVGTEGWVLQGRPHQLGLKKCSRGDEQSTNVYIVTLTITERVLRGLTTPGRTRAGQTRLYDAHTPAASVILPYSLTIVSDSILFAAARGILRRCCRLTGIVEPHCGEPFMIFPVRSDAGISGDPRSPSLALDDEVEDKRAECNVYVGIHDYTTHAGADDALIRGSSNLVLTKSNFTQERSFHLLNANHQVDRKIHTSTLLTNYQVDASTSRKNAASIFSTPTTKSTERLTIETRSYLHLYTDYQVNVLNHASQIAKACRFLKFLLLSASLPERPYASGQLASSIRRLYPLRVEEGVRGGRVSETSAGEGFKKMPKPGVKKLQKGRRPVYKCIYCDSYDIRKAFYGDLRQPGLLLRLHGELSCDVPSDGDRGFPVWRAIHDLVYLGIHEPLLLTLM